MMLSLTSIRGTITEETMTHADYYGLILHDSHKTYLAIWR